MKFNKIISINYQLSTIRFSNISYISQAYFYFTLNKRNIFLLYDIINQNEPKRTKIKGYNFKGYG